MLVGDFTDWQQGALVMEKGEDGVWRTALKLPPGKHSYLFIVDGEWCEDPERAVRCPTRSAATTWCAKSAEWRAQRHRQAWALGFRRCRRNTRL